MKLLISEKGVWLAGNGKPPEWYGVRYQDIDSAVLSEALAGRKRIWRKPHLEVEVSGSLARPFLLSAVEGLRDRSELAKVALREGGVVTGFDAPDSPSSKMELWLEPTPIGTASRVGVVLAPGLGESIAGFAKAHHVRLVSVRPWWTRVLGGENAQRQTWALLALRDDDSVTLLASRDEAWIAAESLCPRPSGALIEGAIRRLELALGELRGPTVRANLTISSSGLAGDDCFAPSLVESFLEPVGP